ncbi:MAG: hypothetical protein RLZZ436_810 [Planctomycetota bacterium]|jgi:CBS domain-containing protein
MYSIVADLMRVRHASVLPESASLREAAERLIVSDCDVLVTTDATGRLTGVVSESCVVRALLSGACETTEIRSIVSHHTPSVTRGAAITTVLPLFRSASVTIIPVVGESGEVCGLLRRRDVIAALMRNAGPAVENTANRDVRRSVSAESRTEPADSATSVEELTAREVPRWSAPGLAGPHFLRGTAAKRVLWPAEDRL